MLPITLRNRKSGSNKSLSNVKMVVTDTANRIRRLPLKIKCFLISSCLASIYIYAGLILSFTTNHLTSETFIQTDKCPACFGHSLCVALKNERILFTGWSRFRWLDNVNLKNVHTATHLEYDDQVMLKKLAHDKEFEDIDLEDFVIRV